MSNNYSDEYSSKSNNFIIGKVALCHSNVVDDLGNCAYYNKNDLNIKRTFKNYMLELQESMKCMQCILDELTPEELKSLKLECKGFNAILYGDDDIIMRLYEKGLVSLFEVDENSEIESESSDYSEEEDYENSEQENSEDENSECD